MLQIYNETEETYSTLEEYIDAHDADDADIYYAQFAYSLATLFDNAKKRSAYRGRNAVDGNGMPLLDKIAMSDDEEDYFDEQLKIGAGYLHRELIAWTKNVFKSFQYKALFDLGNGSETTVQFYITLPEAVYVDMLDVVEPLIAEALVLYPLKEWFKLSGFLSLYAEEENNLERSKAEIKSRLGEKTEPIRTRTGHFKDYTPSM